MSLRVSLVMPCLNGAAYIEAALLSVLDQNYPAIEFVVADGGSTDDTLKILDRHKSGLTTVLSGPDKGMYDALNKGFAMTSGEIMGYLNADDMQLPWTLSVVSEIFETFPQVEWIASLHPLAWDARGRGVRARTRRRFLKEDFFLGAYLPSSDRPGAFWLQQESIFWRRSLWDRAGAGFDASLRAAGDFDLWARFFKLATLYGVDAPLAGFRRHGEQITSRIGNPYEAEASALLLKHGGRAMGLLEASLRLGFERTAPRRFGAKGMNIVWDFHTSSWKIAKA